MSVDTLFAQLKHPNPNLRDRAIGELADLDDATIIPRLMANLDQEDVVYRRASVKALGAIGHSTVPSLVEGLLNSDNETVRASCAKALAQVATWHRDRPFPQSAIDGLQQGMSDPNPVVHLASVMALGQVGVPALDILIHTLKSTENVAIAVSIANTLGSIDDPKAAAVLTESIDDESMDPYVRQLAESALSRMGMMGKKFGN